MGSRITTVQNARLYVSAVAVTSTWLWGQTGQETVNVSWNSLMLTHGGLTLFVAIGLSIANALFAVVLLHRGMAIHEYAQFLFYNSASNSVTAAWETWRRSPQSATRPTRLVYSAILGLLPLLLGVLLLAPVFRIVCSTPPKGMDTLFAYAKLGLGFSLLSYAIAVWLFATTVFLVPQKWRKLFTLAAERHSAPP
jgi:hypothetical protein